MRIPGKSRSRVNGILKVKTYLRIPYKTLRSSDFRALTGNAVKIYMQLLSQWYTNDPDEPVKISYQKLRKNSGDTKKLGYSQISKALNQLEVYGFIIPVKHYRACTEYYIEQKRFTGEY